MLLFLTYILILNIYNYKYNKVGDTMTRRFKSRRRKKFKILKILIFIIVIIFIYKILNMFLLNITLVNSSDEYIKLLLNDSNHHIFNDNSNLVNKLGKNLLTNEIVKPINMLENTYFYPMNSASDSIVIEEDTKYIKDPNPIKIENPKVYLYNTHQLEGYEKANLEEHNIKPSVMMASYILREKLNKLNIPTIVETSDVMALLNANGWNYNNSYKASRYFVEDTLKKYQALDLIIDIHRDAISKSSSTVEINNKKYAKVLFVVGMEHKNYKQNLKVANKINEIIKEKYPTLTRGIMKKSGKNVNGIYNQDLNNNIILMECGGYKNTIDEITNTMEIMSEVIKQYLEEK